MILYEHFVSTIDQYRVNIELQNIVTCIGTYALVLGCDIVPPKPIKGATLTCKNIVTLYWNLSPSIGIYDLVLLGK